MNTLKPKGHKLVNALLGLLIIAVLGTAAWLGYKTITKRQAVRPTPLSVRQSCDLHAKDADLCRFAENFTGMTTYSITLKSPGSTTEIKVNDKDSHLSLLKGKTVLAQYITIGDSVYAKDAGSKQWTKSAATANRPASIKDGVKIDFANLKYKADGKAACGELNCFKYEIINPTDTESKQFVWFDDQDYQIRVWQFTANNHTTTANFSYEPFEITPPTPLSN